SIDGAPVVSATGLSLASISPATVGFGARTGGSAERHDILSWSFTCVGGNTPTPTNTATPTYTSTSTPQVHSCNPASINIGDRGPNPTDTPGPGIPYPSTITLTNQPGSISRVRVVLNNMSHTYPGDLDVLLVGPGGQKVLLMSDTGGGGTLSNATLTFDDT